MGFEQFIKPEINTKPETDKYGIERLNEKDPNVLEMLDALREVGGWLRGGDKSKEEAGRILQQELDVFLDGVERDKNNKS